ncbi:ROK family protein [Fredinandcohnia sp. 179-A 10B2 NHS]|uniref:ROK family protein n=1 Tax=Fredinandcohnia sp. 179-A 10B2 NHS TaxID=3235176 RepID=UPI00399F18B0
MIHHKDPFVIGVDVGGTKIQIGSVSIEGHVITTQRYAMDKRNQDHAVHSVLSALEDFFNTQLHNKKPLAIGIGLVGHIDYQQGIWLNAINIPINKPVMLGKVIRDLYGVPVYLDNDVNVATLAELKWGIGRSTNDFIFLNIGTGIAAGIVSNASLVRGAANYAGEFGHMVVDSNDDMKCTCGQTGCLEKVASGGGILSSTKELLPQYPTSILHTHSEQGHLLPSTIFEAAENGDLLASLIMERAIRGLQIGITNIVNLLNPEYIVIGGGVLRETKLLQKLSETVYLHALPVSRNVLKSISFSQLEPDNVGMIGAAGLGWYHYKGEFK